MHLPPHEIEAYKRKLILKYVIPAFGSRVSLVDEKFEDIVRFCQIHKAVRLQRLEDPGPAMHGHLWFSIGGMSHSYFYNSEKKRESGTIIYNRRQFIFNGDSLLQALDRQDYVQTLEPTEVLCIRYEDVLYLMSKYADINQAIRTLAAQQSIYLRQHMALLQIKSSERVRRFWQENEGFLKCSSQEIQAMHVNLGLRAYAYIISKLR